MSYFYKEIALVSDRPEIIQFDVNRRLHAEEGPALKYRDGYAVYIWKGIKINKDWIESPVTVKQILKEKNSEHRRILIEIFSLNNGPQRLITDSKAKLLDEDVSHGRARKLYEIFGYKYMHVVNGSLEQDGTRREFLIGANPEVTTIHQAVAVSYSRPAPKYIESIRS